MPIPLIKATPRGCPSCEPLVCKIANDREIAMVDWSGQLAGGDSVTSVTHAVSYLSGYSVNSVNLLASGNVVHNDTTTRTLLTGGRADIDCHQTETYRVTVSAGTQQGETLSQAFRVKTKYLYEGAVPCCGGRPLYSDGVHSDGVHSDGVHSGTVHSGTVFVVPGDNCQLHPPLFCKAPGEKRKISFDFSNRLVLPNGELTGVTGSYSVYDALAQGYVTNHTLTVTGTGAYTLNGVISGTTALFGGGTASDKRGQCYYGYFRVYAGLGQMFHYPYTMIIRTPGFQGWCN